MSSRGGKREGAGRPVGRTGIVSVPRRAIRALASEYAPLAMEALISIVRRGTAVGQGAALNRPRDADVITAATAILDRAHGKPGPDRSVHGFVGSYDLDLLSDDQLRTVAGILQLAAPKGSIGEAD